MIVVAGLLVPGTAPAEQPARIETTIASSSSDSAIVAESYVSLYAPLPASVPAHPDVCDRIGYLRFRSANPQAPSDPSQAAAIFVGQPGWTGGAALHDQIARHIVELAANKGRFVEFWSLDRRSNCLEDHLGLAAASAEDAMRYYFDGAALDGRTFSGFATNDTARWLSEIGLAQTLQDEYFVMTHELPDPAVRAKRMFCGGISLGGPITGAFANWDFDGDPSTTGDAGYKQCAGFFALDTSVQNYGRCFDASSCDFGALTHRIPGLDPIVEASVYEAKLAALRSGAAPLFMQIAPLSPDMFAFLAVAAVGAHRAPDVETALTQMVPPGSGVDQSVRFVFSRDATAFATGTPNYRDFRFTNEALFGGLLDNNSNPLSLIQMGLGTFDGGPVVQKDFPAPGTAGQPVVFGSNVLALSGIGRLMIPETPHGPLYTWRAYDRVGDPDAPPQRDSLGRPYTSASQEVTDIAELARSFFEAPADFSEWYFPNRLLLDLSALSGDRTGDLANMRYDNGAGQRPSKGIWAGNGLGSVPFFSSSDNGVLAPGYGHPDTATAAARQNSGQPEIASKTLVDWMTSSTFGL